MIALVGLALFDAPARAQNCNAYPFTLVNGTPNDANKVMADFNSILSCANDNLAENGSNSSITSLHGLTTPLSLSQGGTGTSLSVTPAESGANSDITSLSGLTTPLSIAQGGTGSTTGANLIPAGTVAFFAGATIPTGWVPANGGFVPRTGSGAALFAAIGITYGAGNGTTTFNVPDCRARMLAGMDPSNASGRMTASTAQGVDASALGNVGGQQAHVQTVAEMAQHNHAITDPGHTHTSNAAASTFVAGTTVTGGSGFNTQTATINSATTGITINNNGSSTAFNVLPPTIIFNCMIKE